MLANNHLSRNDIAQLPLGNVAAYLRRRAKTSNPCNDRNQQYSIVALTNAAGTLVERYTYTAYGTLGIYAANGTVRTSSNYANRYTYTGREYDPDLKLYHFRARWYDPTTGGFISRDPLGYVDGMSLYRGYFGVLGMDPTGYVFLHEGAHYRCPSQREYMRIRAEERRGNSGSSGSPPLVPGYYDRVRQQLLKCCHVTRVSGARERIDPSCEYNFYDKNGDAITCEIEAERIIQQLKDARINICNAGGPTYRNLTHMFYEHGNGLGRGYFCDQCQNEFRGPIADLWFFSVENVDKQPSFSRDYSGHSWNQIRCNADGRIYGQVDLWGDFNNPWRDGIDEFGYVGANYSKLYNDWAERRRGASEVSLISPRWDGPPPISTSVTLN